MMEQPVGQTVLEQPIAQVLLVEDNPGDADLVRLRLVESNPPVQVDRVARLSDALQRLASSDPSLILLDLNLPDSRGAETFRRVLEKAPNTPVVILSGQDDEKLAIKAVHHGVQDYLIKGDITSKHLERALRYAIARQGLLRSLEAARQQQLEFKNKFLSHVSHELRTPLTCIHSYVTLLLDGLAGPLVNEQVEHLRTILASVAQLQAMIRDLLEATRAETGKLRITPRCISLVNLIEQAHSMMRPAAERQGLKMTVESDPAIPLVYADPDRILEVLINVLDNAIKFTPAEGSITIKACMLDGDPNAVYLSISDTGRGISQAALPHIFERLFQDPDTTDGKQTGLGLGLYIANQIIIGHGGRMWAASEPGAGTTFSFHLPVYSLARLLQPVITDAGALRPAFALVRVDLKPVTRPPLGNWEDICRQAYDLLHRCVYLDKDLVLPPTGRTGADETLFVVASTTMDQVTIMVRRIQEQLEKLPGISLAAKIEVKADPVCLEASSSVQTLEQQVKTVADRVQELVLASLLGSQNPTKEIKHAISDSN